MTIEYNIVDFTKPGGFGAFLKVCFGDDWEDKAFLVNEPNWGTRKRVDELDLTRGCYWCIGAVPWGKPRRLEHIENVRALVLDDVGTRIHPGDAMALAIGMPTAIVGTSEKNFQYVYRFEKPVSVPDFIKFRQILVGGLQGATDGKDAAHLFRMPGGINRKPGRGNFVVNGRFGISNEPGKGVPLRSHTPEGFVWTPREQGEQA